MASVIGITGGIASGKSSASSELVRRGARRIDADEIARRVLESSEVRDAVRRRWGTGVFVNEASDSPVDRKRLAAAVFGSEHTEDLHALNEITHPAILSEIKRRVQQCRDAGITAVLDAPLLYETGLDRLCDIVIFIDADFSVRAQRARERGWTDEELRNREAAQMPVTEKKDLADLVIPSGGTCEELAARLQSALPEISLPNSLKSTDQLTFPEK